MAGTTGKGVQLVVRLSVMSDVANNWQKGAAPQLEANAREQAERAVKVRYMGQAMPQLELLEAQESWLCENGQSKISIDFTYRVGTTSD